MFVRVNLTKDELEAPSMQEEMNLAIEKEMVPDFILEASVPDDEKKKLFYNWLFYNHHGFETNDLEKLHNVEKKNVEDSDNYRLDSLGVQKMPTLGELVYFKTKLFITNDTANEVINRLEKRQTVALNDVIRCPTCLEIAQLKDAHSLAPCGHSFCTDCLNRHQSIASRRPIALSERQAHIYKRRFPCLYCREPVDAAIPIFRP